MQGILGDLLRLLILAFVMAVLLFGCTGQTQSGGNSNPTTGNTSTAAASGNTVNINITAQVSGFSPSTITVHKGDHVVITVTSTDVPHTFTIPGYNINEQVPGGQSVTFDFIADKTGTFPFNCMIHPSTMTGNLIVQ